MKQYVYAMYNRKIHTFDVPHYQIMAADDYLASIRNAVILGKLETSKVESVELYCLGEFDDKSGKFILTDAPQLVGDFDDLIPTA